MNAPVITGVGVVSPFGVGFPVFLDALERGASAVGTIRSFDASAYPTRVAGEVPVVHPDAGWVSERLPRGHRARLRDEWTTTGLLRDRKASFALVAAAEAWDQAGLGEAARGATTSLALGLEQAFLEDLSAMHDGRLRWDLDAASTLPCVRVRAKVNVASQLSRTLLAISGPEVVHVSACASGTLSLAHAAALVRRGEADVVLCGGVDSMVNPLGVGGMSRLNAPSPRASADACRPFDRRRDGLAMGEGAAMFIVENADRARARGARVLARVLGSGSTQDAYRVTAPRPDGAAAARAMSRALSTAGLTVDDIGYVNAHGTGTPLNDSAESKAIRDVFGDRADVVPVSSIKGAIGHAMAAAGALELAACLLAFERDLLPGTAHHREVDPECPISVIGEDPQRARVAHILKNSFGFGGQNASVVLGRPA